MSRIAALSFFVLALLPLGCSRGKGNPSELRISGNIEVVQAQVAFKVPGRIVSRAVDEGQFVKAGDVVARLDDTELSQQSEVRQAEVDAARAMLRDLEAGSRPEEIRQAKASLDQALADQERLALDFARQQQLLQKEVISQREFDASRTAYEASQARAREFDQRYALVKKGARTEQVAAARARLDQATKALDLSRTQLGNAVLLSPMDGVVTSKHAEVGEVLAAGSPVVSIENLKDVWLRAYVDESDLGRVKVGQKVGVTTDTWPEKRYEGKVSFISQEAEFTPKSVQTQKERAKLVYRIKVDIANPQMELKAGMPADASIEVGS